MLYRIRSKLGMGTGSRAFFSSLQLIIVICFVLVLEALR